MTYDDLKTHIGHRMVAVPYGISTDPNNIVVECVDCNAVLLSKDRPDSDYGTEDDCRKAPHGCHVPDFKTLQLAIDGGYHYFDINCIYCGRSGCAGNINQVADKLSNGVQW